MAIPQDPDTKSDRLNVRIPPYEKAMLEAAADLERTTLSQFVVREAVVAAGRRLQEQTRFELDDQEWAAFSARLDEPARHIPALMRLAEQPPIFDE
jgi:uncharacterized protein (DUF1778 family)